MSNTKQLPAEIVAILREPFPAEALSTVPGGAKLTSIKSMYVIERLNKAFGIGRWSLDHEVIEANEREIVVGGKLHLVDYPDCQFPATYGGMKGYEKTDRSDLYKGAVTACIGKAASFLEVGIDVYKGKVKATSNGFSQPAQQRQPQTKPAPKTEIITLESLEAKHLKAGKWNMDFHQKGTDYFIWLYGKDGKAKEVKLTPEQKETCMEYAINNIEPPPDLPPMDGDFAQKKLAV